MSKTSSDRRDKEQHVAPTKASRSDVEEEKTVESATRRREASPVRENEAGSVYTDVHLGTEKAEDGRKVLADVYGPEKLKRHRTDVAGRVWVPDIWGQEELLKDWIDCSAFDRSLFPKGIASAREALVEECRRANSGGLPIGNRC